jgi:AcrR family transcriptional regulator
MSAAIEFSPVKTARRARIVEAAEAVFRRSGFRGASMEAIAEAASMSKVTLYGYFRDKEAVFLAVAEHLAGRMETIVFATLDQPGPLPLRVTSALLSKQDMVQTVVRSSAFSDELFASSGILAGGIFADLDARITAKLGVTLAEAGIDRPAETARLLFAAALGIGEHVRDTANAKADIARLVAEFLKADAHQA